MTTLWLQIVGTVSHYRCLLIMLDYQHKCGSAKISHFKRATAVSPLFLQSNCLLKWTRLFNCFSSQLPPMLAERLYANVLQDKLWKQAKLFCCPVEGHLKQSLPKTLNLIRSFGKYSKWSQRAQRWLRLFESHCCPGCHPSSDHKHKLVSV